MNSLREFKRSKKLTLPEHLAAISSSLPGSGYQWLNYLSEVNWGGILADDMGLGKTVQALIIPASLSKMNMAN